MIKSKIKLKKLYWDEIKRRLEESAPEDLEDQMSYLISLAIEDAYLLGRHRRAIKENKLFFGERKC